MQLSLKEAAARLGQSERQVRYLVKRGQLKASKIAGRWVIDEADLPVTPESQKRRQTRARALGAAVDEALAPHISAGRAYSVLGVRAFVEAVDIYRSIDAHSGEGPARECMEACVLALSRGAHAFHQREKAEAWQGARSAAAEAVAWLYLQEGDETSALGGRIEEKVLPAIGGLLRRQERRPAR